MRALVILSLQVKRQGDAKDKLNLTPDFTFSGWRQDQTRSSTFLSQLTEPREPARVEVPMSAAVTSGVVNGLDNSVDVSFLRYPPHRPFINSSYQRSPSKAVMSYPETNRDGVLSALRTLQEKMQKLELDKRNAESKLHTLEIETDVYRNSLNQNGQDADTPRGEAAYSGTNSSSTAPSLRDLPTKDLELQLSSAETRCQLLEKQLDYMRKMVHNAERDRSEALQKANTLQHQHEPSPLKPDYHAQLDRISELERDHLRLTATQTLAEAKIKELEEKLREERLHRQVLQERAIDLESVAVSHRLLLDTTPESEERRDESTKKRTHSSRSVATKKKKKKVAGKKPALAKPEPMKHYRLNLAEIPFVAGKDLTDLLSQLQDELGQLGFEHQELMHQVSEARDPRIREDLERELDGLVVRMEAKAQQISRVRLHQQKLEDAKRQLRKHGKKTASSEATPRPHSAMGRLANNHKSPESDRCRSHSATRKGCLYRQKPAPPTLNVLKDMKKLQTTLRRDDLSWE
ncbi:hypothetical protein C0Q70_11749 [Pomacea canaliculata]|uniref:Cep57 centrosome localisation domain-containing protein n=1 Tax=Pomacea canaliculata TaxID=400727 RepID=A0A2T7P6U7_POMCA|nr:hypothetical protein C0Q70_11749 [Pomacea canaliculata]